jgi:hypothetical protein
VSATTSSVPDTPAKEHDPHRTLYWIIGAVAVVLAIIGLITYSGQKQSDEATAKAQQLTQAFEQAGITVPADIDIITRSLGTDGGAVCDNPASALGRALLFDQLYNGAATVGRRPVIADTNVLKGELAILNTYCPEKVQQFRDKTQDLKLDDTIGN